MILNIFQIKFLTIIFILITTPVLFSCGNGNLFSSLTTVSQKDKAQNSIYSGDYPSAISTLVSYLNNNPSDTQAIGMLGTAYMLSAGYNLLNITVSILTNTSSAKNNFQAILSSMPNGSSTNITYLTNAVNILSTISSSQRTANQNYQLALAQAGLAILIIKAVCLDSAGNISTSLTNAMSSADSTKVYTNLQNAQTNLASAGISSGTSTGSSLLANLFSQINATAGASNDAKVTNFIISQQ
ncbi:hypothetical protein [Fluviispira sanaruensis]|uniref:Uncharacterized protein n=1 Tax=Fluviispira sanaruensis TaxID=2493639 RepID=A0A4P2VHF7_FLUSA|nr:hypothetical protein [Fluviispira sanaruensis]BBH52141.1 hypothetical protein JCM31447_314300 [Fluviispira sanaruensis]